MSLCAGGQGAAWGTAVVYLELAQGGRVEAQGAEGDREAHFLRAGERGVRAGKDLVGAVEAQDRGRRRRRPRPCERWMNGGRQGLSGCGRVELARARPSHPVRLGSFARTLQGHAVVLEELVEAEHELAALALLVVVDVRVEVGISRLAQHVLAWWDARIKGIKARGGFGLRQEAGWGNRWTRARARVGAWELKEAAGEGEDGGRNSLYTSAVRPFLSFPPSRFARRWRSACIGILGISALCLSLLFFFSFSFPALLLCPLRTRSRRCTSLLCSTLLSLSNSSRLHSSSVSLSLPTHLVRV